MRITIITQYFLPEMGAPPNRLFELAKGLQEKGCDVRVISAMPNYPTGKIFKSHQGKFSSYESIDNIPVKRYWIFASNSHKALPRILSMISFSITSLFSAFFIRRNRPDFIMVESPPLTLAFSALILSKLAGSKMIMNVSDLWPLSAKELGAISDGVLYRLIEKLELFLYNRAAICSGQSQEIVDHIKFRTKTQVYLFRNGVDSTRFNVELLSPSDKNHKIKIVYAGLLGVAQGIYELCRQIDFSALGIEFHIYGTGAEGKKIEDFITMNPHRGIAYCGVMPRTEMPRILQQYDATIVALVKNIYGAVPSKIYESMAAGLPIFFSGEGEGAKIVDQHQTGWTNAARDWSKLKENLKTFSQLNSKVRNQMREHCRNIARNKFDRSRQIEDLYNHIMSKK